MFNAEENRPVGHDPKGVRRDESRNHRLVLPSIAREMAAPAAIVPASAIGMTGQLQSILDELERAWREHEDG